MMTAAASPALGQRGTGSEGGTQFLIPIGGRIVAMGQASAAVSGAEAVWWNPALIGRAGREFSFQLPSHASPTVESDAGAALVIPMMPVGSFALSARYLNLGQFDAFSTTGEQTGFFTVTTTIVGATFGTTFGDRLAVGVTAKDQILTVSCTGVCLQLPASASVPAADIGGHAYLFADSFCSPTLRSPCRSRSETWGRKCRFEIRPRPIRYRRVLMLASFMRRSSSKRPISSSASRPMSS
jgi:hypothetical protein